MPAMWRGLFTKHLPLLSHGASVRRWRCCLPISSASSNLEDFGCAAPVGHAMSSSLQQQPRTSESLPSSDQECHRHLNQLKKTGETKQDINQNISQCRNRPDSRNATSASVKSRHRSFVQKRLNQQYWPVADIKSETTTVELHRHKSHPNRLLFPFQSNTLIVWFRKIRSGRLRKNFDFIGLFCYRKNNRNKSVSSADFYYMNIKY